MSSGKDNNKQNQSSNNATTGTGKKQSSPVWWNQPPTADHRVDVTNNWSEVADLKRRDDALETWATRKDKGPP